MAPVTRIMGGFLNDIFGDMHGLLQAASRSVLADYVQQKMRSAPLVDPVEARRRGWERRPGGSRRTPPAMKRSPARSLPSVQKNSGASLRGESAPPRIPSLPATLAAR